MTFHVCAHCALRIAQGTSEIDDFHQLLLLPLIGTREAFLKSIYDGLEFKRRSFIEKTDFPCLDISLGLQYVLALPVLDVI